ncbi:lipid-A-disaccharide synthase [Altericista sp. CCNU0014]|uniref:lipid-A-disaccharide synthase n=1 Tax=Altericista sp. CCNU0014 TaxID=3082949 RepID=UPI00384BAFC1
MNLTGDPVPIDVLILSNGPGEVMTWVRPVVRALRSQFSPEAFALRISVVLSPCPHASGREAEVLKGFPEVNRVQGPDAFWPFLLWGKTERNWDWHGTGAVVFLGGEQFFAVAVGKRLGYKIVTYAEWMPRWLRWIDGCGVTQESAVLNAPVRFRAKVRVVGDLIAEAQVLDPATQAIEPALGLPLGAELVGLLPGSKSVKLSLLMPLGMAIADRLHRIRPQTQLVIPVAPTLTLAEISRYADPASNPYFEAVGGCQATLMEPEAELPYLATANGARVLLWSRVPAYDLLAQCQLCITTVGANTAELASLAVPMLVLLPTQQLDLMRAWDGIPGLLANLPFLGTGFAKLINAWVLERGLGLRAWPNIWAGCEIVPEWVGHILPQPAGDRIAGLLDNPTELDKMRAALKQVRGVPGAAQRLAALVQLVLE